MKKAFTILLSILMVALMIPAMAYAETYEAQIGEMKYVSLQDAVSAANKTGADSWDTAPVIELLSDCEVKATHEPDNYGAVHFYANWGDVKDAYFIIQGNNHTIKLVGEDPTKNKKERFFAVKFSAGTHGKIYNAVVDSNGKGHGAVNATNAELICENVTVKNANGGWSAFGVTTSNVVLTNCTATESIEQVISVANSTDSVAGAQSIAIINSGTYDGTLRTETDGKGMATLSIKGGNFSFNVVNGDLKIDKGANESKPENKTDIVISGGVFDVNPTEYVPEGYEAAANTPEAGKWTVQGLQVAKVNGKVYNTLQEAINAATTGTEDAPVTIEILKDIVLNSEVSINKNNVVISGNGHTIAANNAKADWKQYKVGEEKQKYGSIDLISVSGNNVTVKDLTVDVKDYRGMSCMTTKGGSNVTYENITYLGRGSGHYYGYAGNGLIIFKNCTINTKGYGIHLACEDEKNTNDRVVIENCKVYGWNSFGTCESVTAKNTYFGFANDEGKNGILAVFKPYCQTFLTNCTFSEKFTEKTDASGKLDSEKYGYCGFGTGKEISVIFNGCKVEGNHSISEIVNFNDNKQVFESDTAMNNSLFIFDTKGDAANGYTAGTFVTKVVDGTSGLPTAKLAEGYKFNEVSDNVFAISEIAKVETSAGGETVISIPTENGKTQPVEVKGENGQEVSGDEATQAAAAITSVLENKEATTYVDPKIDEAIPATVMAEEKVEGFDLSMILNAVREEANKKYVNPETEAEVSVKADNTITIKTAASSNEETFTDTDVVKQMAVNLEAATVEKITGEATTTTVTSMTFDVKPVATITINTTSGTETITAVIPNEAIKEAITFRLPVDKSVTDTTAAVYHEGEFLGNFPIEKDGENKYIEIKSNKFSLFKYILFNAASDAVAKISDKPYLTLADAVAAVQNNETIVLQKASETGTITVSRQISFTIDLNSKENKAKIVAGAGYELVKSGNTYTFKLKEEPEIKPFNPIEFFEYNVEKYMEILAAAQQQQAIIDVQTQTGKLTEAQLKALVGDLKITVRTENQTRGIKVYVNEIPGIKAITDAGYTISYDFYNVQQKKVPTNNDYKITKIVDKTENWYLNTAAKKGKKYYYKVVVNIKDEDGNVVAQTALNQCLYGCRTRK